METAKKKRSKNKTVLIIVAIFVGLYAIGTVTNNAQNEQAQLTTGEMGLNRMSLRR